MSEAKHRIKWPVGGFWVGVDHVVDGPFYAECEDCGKVVRLESKAEQERDQLARALEDMTTTDRERQKLWSIRHLHALEKALKIRTTALETIIEIGETRDVVVARQALKKEQE